MMRSSRQGLLAAGPASPARALIGLFLISLVVSVGVGGILNVVFPLSPREVHLVIRSLGVWGPISLVFIVAALIVFVPAPTIPFDIAAGIGYGAGAGTLYVLTGHIAGATIAFLLARRFGRPLLARLVPVRAIVSVDRLAETLGVQLLVLMRLLPLFDFKVVSYAAGLTDISLGKYLGATIAGITLPVLGMVSVGADLTGHPLRAALIVGTFGLFAGVGAAYMLFGHPPRLDNWEVPG
ncbi:MAG TPA: VTT domain-containing protein [Dehalococcoidia bacterium]|nr:VTT domain-containing protein [Dehalococcoidia bacterium]